MQKTTTKQLKYTLPATDIDMGGFPVKQALPNGIIQQIDPFLLLHHAEVKFNDLQAAKHQGVGPHPHRGFSPVTFVIQGEVHHRDSRGNSQVAKAGDVQWMHAGAGIVHSERPSDTLIQHNGKQEIIQLWINSPAAHKMDIPTYHHIASGNMPTMMSADGLVNTKLVVGNYQQQQGKINGLSDLFILWGKAQANSTESFYVPPNFNAMLYVISGAVRIGNHNAVRQHNLAVLNNSNSKQTNISTHFTQATQFLLMAGTPLSEEVTQYGPFVMNTQTEILEAMRDYQMGKMGVLIEE